MSQLLEGNSLGEQHSSVAQLAYETIRRSIIQGRIKPGTRLVESSLAEQLGVSRMPVREALRQLSEQGYVSIVPRRGAVVTSLSEKDALELYDIRGALEQLAARLAAERRTAEDIARLEDILEQGKIEQANGNWAELSRLNSMFHEAVAATSRNQHLAQLMHAYRDKILWIFSRSAQERGEASWSEHAEILQAIIRGEVTNAGNCAARHVEQARLAIVEHLDHA